MNVIVQLLVSGLAVVESFKMYLRAHWMLLLLIILYYPVSVICNCCANLQQCSSPYVFHIADVIHIFGRFFILMTAIMIFLLSTSVGMLLWKGELSSGAFSCLVR